MFAGDQLAELSRGKTILLANPPFESFKNDELTAYSKAGTEIVVKNKAAQLRRTLPELHPGSVFGVVIPQIALHLGVYQEIRRIFTSTFELREVSLFPDKVFSFSDAESAVLIGRRLPKARKKRQASVSAGCVNGKCRRLGKHMTLRAPRIIEQSRFNRDEHADMRISRFGRVWLEAKGKSDSGWNC